MVPTDLTEGRSKQQIHPFLMVMDVFPQTLTGTGPQDREGSWKEQLWLLPGHNEMIP